jgi:hypothetical protein
MANGRQFNAGRDVRGVNQDMIGDTVVANGGEGEVDMEAAAGRGAMMANAALNSPEAERIQFQTGIANLLARVTKEGSLQEVETGRQTLIHINAVNPELAQQIIRNAGSPEWLTMDFGGGAADPAVESAAVENDSSGSPARSRAKQFHYPPMERINTHGAGARKPGEKYESRGLGKLTELEYRTRNERTDGVTAETAKPWQWNMIEHMANSNAYRALNDTQAQDMVGAEVTPEMVAQMNRFEQRELLRAVTDNPASDFVVSPEQLIGARLNEKSALYVPRRIRAQMVGGRSMFDAENAALLGDIAGRSTEAGVEGAVPQRDALLAFILRNAGDGTKTFDPEMVDRNFKWLRYNFPMSREGEIVRPGWAPSGIAAAKMARGILRLRDDIPNWQSTATPVFDAMIRSIAGTTPSRKTYHDLSGRSAYDFSQLILPPERGGYYHKLAEKEGLGWPFFQEGVQMNPQTTPINLGGLLLDSTQSAPQPGATINTTEEVPPPVAPESPPVMPAEGDVSMYGPRMNRMNPSILAALLA